MTIGSFFSMTGITLLMTLVSTLLSYIIGLPIGILLYNTSKNGTRPNKWIYMIVGAIVNILRSIPCLILVVICMPATRAVFQTGTGEWYTILIPLVVSALGFVARMVENSLRETEVGKIEAVKSLGATNSQIIFKVVIPESRSSLIAGLAVVLVSILGYTSFAYNISAGGLIEEIWRFYSKHTSDFYTRWEFYVLVVAVVAIVILFQELGLFIAKKLDKRRLLK